MDILKEIPAFVRDFGVFATIMIGLLLILAFNPFTFRSTGKYSFVISRKDKEVIHAAPRSGDDP